MSAEGFKLEMREQVGMERVLHGTRSYRLECWAHVDGTVDYRLPNTRCAANVETFRWEGVGTREKSNFL
jgi:hypothetical protein